MSGETEKAEEADRKKADEGIARATKEIKGIKIMLDTNALITGVVGPSYQKKVIADIAAQNETYICDTIFWEFLRNCSVDKFRERHRFLSNNNFLRMVHEDENVEKMYQAIWSMYLCCYRNNPKKMSSIAITDLWIIAATLQQDIDNILTSDKSDFPEDLFNKKEFYIGKGKTIILSTFNRRNGRKYLKEALDKGVMVSFQTFRND